jgi:UDP-3-O-[3-hydroxymyristoyl] glucosamine N-acyltransferase
MTKNIKKIVEYLILNDIKCTHNIDDNLFISSLASLQNANNSHLTFFNDEKKLSFLKLTKAKVCLISSPYIKFLPTTCSPIIVSDPHLSFAHLTNFFDQEPICKTLISKNTSLSNDTILGDNVQLMDNVIISSNSKIGNNVVIHGNSVIGPNIVIGNNTTIYSNCSISNSIIGKNCIIQSGTIIGNQGFGFTLKDKIELKHIGNVVISDNVQIGSNAAIDRALLDSTYIGNNVRIDNLVHIAHGVSIGDDTIIAGQVGIAGSTKVGKNCLIGGQVGITGHIEIGNNVTIAAKSGVTKDIKDNSTIAGFPAIDIKIWKRSVIKHLKAT